MSRITTLESNVLLEYRKESKFMLTLEKHVVEYYFPWLKLELKNQVLIGMGRLIVNDKSYNVRINYCPFFPFRFDRIYIDSDEIKYHSKIHLYKDLSLCLYHPTIDREYKKIIPLVKMIPWITEWCVHYEEWKKYKVWLGKEISH